MLAKYSYVSGIPKTGLDIPRGTTLEKAAFSLASRYQLKKTSWLELGPSIHFTLLVLGHYLALICAYPLGAATVSMNLCVYQSCTI